MNFTKWKHNWAHHNRGGRTGDSGTICASNEQWVTKRKRAEWRKEQSCFHKSRAAQCDTANRTHEEKPRETWRQDQVSFIRRNGM